MNEAQIEVKLWDYIDGNLPAEEISFVENLVKTNQEWRDKHAELLEVHTLMNDNFELDQPSMSFTRNIMEEIGKLQITPASRKYLDKRIIRTIGAFFVCSIVAMIVYAFSQTSFNLNGTEPAYLQKLESVNYNKFTNTNYLNVFLMINTVLGLVLLDFYLGAKRKKLSPPGH